jgi:hypothetical protein
VHGLASLILDGGIGQGTPRKNTRQVAHQLGPALLDLLAPALGVRD